MTRASFLSLILYSGLAAADDGFPAKWFLNAHNSYPEHGRGRDRLARARRAGLWAVELDLAWSEARGRAVISHDAKKVRGDEPTLDEYFFRPLARQLQRLPRGEPGLLLMLDFKSDHPGPVREVHATLAAHRHMLTTSARDGAIRWGPLTVILSENAAAIALFEKLTPPGEPYLAMAIREPPDRKWKDDIRDYFPEPATPFHRLFNFDWRNVERDPNPNAGPWTAAESARLETIVNLAREKGYWTRAWTLNATTTMWGTGRNFGSRAALLQRWRAARAAGLDCIATDEYELAGRFMASERPRR